MVDLEFWGDLAQKAFVNGFPSTNWANRMVEPWKGLPFGPNLHAVRPQRLRTLTGPVEAPQDSLWSRLQFFAAAEPVRHTEDQLDSALFAKLPIDVRLLIYEEVLGNMVFHLEARNNGTQIVKEICCRPDLIDEPIHQCHISNPRKSPSFSGNGNQHSSSLLPLLLTCRRVYSEVIPILYGTNVFEFRQGKGAFYFLRLMLPPQRLANIRHFRLHMRLPHHPHINSRSRRDWETMLMFFTTEMPALNKLYLRLLTNYITETQITETDDVDGAEWTKPIMRMVVDVQRNRRCHVKFVTPGVSGGVAHDCIGIFKETAKTTGLSPQERLIELASIALHERIRVSIEGPT
ncbi:Hypothetical protein R9X50_00180800 [Acrodontium crateriforme]|uniref:DUF7730 domain-containing protein n=1 Tax=Acrodontium crateriforme TaxID=150365 RepID=A0AAQ3LZM6_9PEZI|nr:Hypothetical protein R9X50_00180800 [Acrodontium crateriforme]